MWQEISNCEVIMPYLKINAVYNFYILYRIYSYIFYLKFDIVLSLDSIKIEILNWMLTPSIFVQRTSMNLFISEIYNFFDIIVFIGLYYRFTFPKITVLSSQETRFIAFLLVLRNFNFSWLDNFTAAFEKIQWLIFLGIPK